MIRMADRTDVPRLAEFCRDMAGHWPLYQWSDFSYATAVAEMMDITDPAKSDRVAFISPGGLIAGRLVRPPFSAGMRFAQEIAWYARDGSGLLLLETFARWAKIVGAVGVRMAYLERDPRREAAFHRVAKRLGYIPVERAYGLPL